MPIRSVKSSPAAERFPLYVKAAPNGCLEWTSKISSNGYGWFHVARRGGKNVQSLAHRYAWEQARGPIPAGMTIDHLCRNRRCVNVSHMEMVSGRINTLRGTAPTAINARKVVCIRGHELTPRPEGGRRCEVCKLAQQRVRRARARAVA